MFGKLFGRRPDPSGPSTPAQPANGESTESALSTIGRLLGGAVASAMTANPLGARSYASSMQKRGAELLKLADEARKARDGGKMETVLFDSLGTEDVQALLARLPHHAPDAYVESSQASALQQAGRMIRKWTPDLVDDYLICAYAVHRKHRASPHRLTLSHAQFKQLGVEVGLVEKHGDRTSPITQAFMGYFRDGLLATDWVSDQKAHRKMIDRLTALVEGEAEASSKPPFATTNEEYVTPQPYPAPRASEEELFEFIEAINAAYAPAREVLAAGRQVPLSSGREPSEDEVKAFVQPIAAMRPRVSCWHDPIERRIAGGRGKPLTVEQARTILTRKIVPMPDWAANAPPSVELLGVGGTDPTWTLVRHLLTATSATPSSKWLKTFQTIQSGLGAEPVRKALHAWLSLVIDYPASKKERKDRDNYAWLTYIAAGLKNARDRRYSMPDIVALAHRCDAIYPTLGNWSMDFAYHRRASAHHAFPEQLSDINASIARGAVWALASAPREGDEQFFGTLAKQFLTSTFASGSYRSLAAGNACLWALGQIGSRDAVMALGRLRRSVRDNRVATQVDKAMQEAATKAGLTVAELEEMAVPDFGLAATGALVEEIEGYEVELKIVDGSVTFECRSPGGKALKSVPSELKKSDAFKELKEAADEIARLLPVQKDRIERSYLQAHHWPFAVWKERYLDHAVVGAVAQRLIWNFAEGASVRSAIWRGGQLVDATGAAVEPAPDAVVTLWHPIDASSEQVSAWRRFVMAQKIRQPFKQAYREIYALTEAEVATATFSNRFAAHILKQHQYMALAKARGWSVRHRMWVDAPNNEPIMIDMPAFGLWAEIFIEGAGGDHPEVLDSQAYVYVTTDQVRFHHGRDVVRLEDVPPGVFSEVMRDCDLFVGVASIGADPNWVNRGADALRPNQWQRDAAEYWGRAAFGELAESAKMRREMIAELLPSLSIASKCQIEDRFLRVQGSLRAYKIHFNSGNILMEPNDQYLCIVPSHTPEQKEPMFVPFDGDRTLSIIISKAMMLAADDKIKESSIVSQIKSR